LKMNIVLTGFMGTGKSIVGEKLAQRLGMGYIDTDQIIEEREGCEISKIFKEKGEDYFRKIETEVVKEVSSFNNCVIATGGGVVLKEENIKALRRKGIIISLSANPRVILERTSKSKKRPLLLNCPDPYERIERMLNFRKPYYEKMDLKIDTSFLNPTEVVEKILKFLRKDGDN